MHMWSTLRKTIYVFIIDCYTFLTKVWKAVNESYQKTL